MCSSQAQHHRKLLKRETGSVYFITLARLGAENMSSRKSTHSQPFLAPFSLRNRRESVSSQTDLRPSCRHTTSQAIVGVDCKVMRSACAPIRASPSIERDPIPTRTEVIHVQDAPVRLDYPGVFSSTLSGTSTFPACSPSSATFKRPPHLSISFVRTRWSQEFTTPAHVVSYRSDRQDAAHHSHCFVLPSTTCYRSRGLDAGRIRSE